MKAIQKVLFPTDFSRESRKAFAYAVDLARRYGAELHLFHAVVLHEGRTHVLDERFPDLSGLRDTLEAMAVQDIEELILDHDVPETVITEVLREADSAGPAIVRYAETHDIDLIVIATHGRRGVRRFLLGSVAAEVVRLSTCSVLAVRRTGEEEAVHPVSRILAPVDFSESGNEALEAACGLASRWGSELRLLHVLEDFIHPAFYNMGATSITDLQPDIIERTEAVMDDLVGNTVPCDGVSIDRSAVEGHPGREIVRYIQDHHVDLVVMATHGRRGIRDFLLGSTTENVIAGADCPVLVVKRRRA